MILAYSEERGPGWTPPEGSDRYGLDNGLPAQIVRMAHRDKLRVSAHVESARDFEVAVAAGVDIVAPMPGFWPDVKSATSSPDEAAASYREAMLEVYRHNLTVLRKYGVRIAIGSDQYRSTSIPEALAIQKAGLMDAASLLRALSSDAAATIFPARAPFNLSEGSPADFLVFGASPLADFTAIQPVRVRVKDGRELPWRSRSSSVRVPTD